MAKQKNQLPWGTAVDLTIDAYTHKGWGVGRLDGRAVFVPGALAGERVNARLTGSVKSVPVAEILTIESASPERVCPECPDYAACGGCAVSHMSYREQLLFKRSVVVEQLRRVGGIEEAEQLVRPAVGMDSPLYYRNKGVFHAEYRDGQLRLGFWAEGTHQLAGDCRLLFPVAVRELLALAVERLNQYPELCQVLDSVLVRYSGFDGGLMLIACQCTAAGDTSWRQFFAELAACCPALKVFGTAVNRGRGQELAELQLFSELTSLTEELNGVRYQISPVSFFQINTEQTAKMLRRVIDLAGDCRSAIDAYGGIGTIGLQLAAAGIPTTGIEIVPVAVQDYLANAGANGLNNVNCLLGRAERLFERAAAVDGLDALVVVDPPRRGCAPEFLQELAAFAPARIIYVSCNPATLVRDLKLLLAGGAYSLDFAEPYDFFPHSYHVETVVRLTKKMR